MIKSDEEISIIKNGARIADLGAEEIVKHIKPGQSELEIAIAGRDKMEREIAKSYPDAEYMDTWVWFQSGINTDGCLLYTSPSPRDGTSSRMPSSA